MNLKKWLFLPMLALPAMVKGHHGTGNSMAATSVITPSSAISPSVVPSFPPFPSLPSDVFHSSTRDSSGTSGLKSALKKMTSKTVNGKAAQSTPTGLQTIASTMKDAADKKEAADKISDMGKAAQSTPAGLQTIASKMNDTAGNAGKAAEQVKDATNNTTGTGKLNTGAPVGKPVGKPDESKSDAAKSSAKVDNASQKANVPGGGLPPGGPNSPGSSPNKGDLGDVD